MASAKIERGTIQGWHVLAGMVTFFGVIFAVNGVFLVSALRTNTGIVSQQPYRKGLDYNRRIAADERQHTLGWTGDASIAASTEARIDPNGATITAGHGSVSLVLKDRYGRPVTGLRVRGFVGRRSRERFDIPLAVPETPSPAIYRADVRGLAPGNWLLQLEAGRSKPDATEIVYRLRKRLWLKP